MPTAPFDSSGAGPGSGRAGFATARAGPVCIVSAASISDFYLPLTRPRIVEITCGAEKVAGISPGHRSPAEDFTAPGAPDPRIAFFGPYTSVTSPVLKLHLLRLRRPACAGGIRSNGRPDRTCRALPDIHPAIPSAMCGRAPVKSLRVLVSGFPRREGRTPIRGGRGGEETVRRRLRL